MDEDRVTTFCPRCGKPIIWQRTVTGPDSDELKVVGWACFCALDDDEWADLSEQAADAFDGREG